MVLSDIIMELCAMSGPSGFEGAVSERIAELFAPLADEVSTDVMGNVIAVKRCGKENARRILLDAHMDEIGFIVTGAEDGYLRFQTLGGVDSRMLPASRIKFMTEPPVYGVVAVMPVHALPEGESDKPLKIDDLYIDVGLTQEEAERLLPPGTTGVYDIEPMMLKNGLICAKTQDDRAGVAIILKTMELLANEKLNIDVYAMASTQEEVGLRGAKPAAFAVDPDWAIAIDVTHGKTPDCSDWRTVKTGGGAVIVKGPNMNRRLVDTAVKAAEANDIKYQISVEPDGDSGTNTTVIQTAREGVATALFSLPLKYMHTPVEVVAESDCEAMAKLICETVKSLSGGECNA